MNSTTCSGLMKRLLEISIKRIEEVFQTPPNNSSKSSGGKGVVIEQQRQLHCLLGPLELRPSPGRERWRQTFMTAWQALLTGGGSYARDTAWVVAGLRPRLKHYSCDA